MFGAQSLSSQLKGGGPPYDETNGSYISIVKAKFHPFHPGYEDGFHLTLSGLEPLGLGELPSDQIRPFLTLTGFPFTRLSPLRISNDPLLLKSCPTAAFAFLNLAYSVLIVF